MNALIMSVRSARLLAVAGLLVAALAVTALAPARPARADTPQPIILTPPRLDLRLTGAGVKYLNGHSFPAGYYLFFGVRNAGPFGPAGPFNVGATIVTENGTSFQTFAVAGLEHGGSRMFWHKLPSPNTRDHDLVAAKIAVDIGNSVHETNEANNTSVFHFKYGMGPC
ncbi:MAG: CARDB domain-containing protein [Dehalococcoidia bacterium]